MIIRIATIDDSDVIAKIHVDTWRTTYAGIIPQEYLDNLSYAKRAKLWKSTLVNPKEKITVLVACFNEQIIGFSSVGPNGELYAIYLLQKYQGRGLGKSLFEESVRQLLNCGLKKMTAWVLKENPACKFYDANGGIPMNKKYADIGGKRLLELAYGWSNTLALPN